MRADSPASFGLVYYRVIGLTAVTWAVAVVVWKTTRPEERWGRVAE
jgi:hypothetical protein